MFGFQSGTKLSIICRCANIGMGPLSFAHVRSRSISEVGQPPGQVRLSLNSGNAATASACRFRAKHGSYSITASALARSASGITRPSAFAVLRGFLFGRNQLIDLFWEPPGKHGRGKYGTFDKKIDGALALDLIGHETKHNLEIVRCVRNVFAHSMADVRFTTPPIRAACDLIRSPPGLPKERFRSRKSRFAYCQICDRIFRIFLGSAALRWIAPGDPRHAKKLFP
jgi:hypothetical protein